MSEKVNDCYIGVKPCGCVVAVTSMDMPKKELAKTLADFVKSGYEVQATNWDENRHRFGACNCDKKQKEPTLL
jgi:hypothetical protein